MFSSEPISRDMSRSSGFLLSNPSSSKHVSAEAQFSKSRDSMGSDLFLNQSQLQQQGLARYRSAPSSFLAALMDSTTDNSSSGDESEALFSALLDGPPGPDLNQKNSSGGNQMHYHLKQEAGAESEPRPASLMGYESAVSGGGGAIVGSYSVGLDNPVNNGNTSNLLRQSSSPAGFFNGYGIMGEVGNYKLHNHSKGSSSAAGSMSNHMNFSSGPSSSSRFMPSIPENVNESMGTRNHENGHLGRANSANAREFDAVFPQDSWNDNTSFNSLKRSRDDDMKMFSSFNGVENGETRKNPHGLVHHMSLPKTSSEMAEVEKFLQFQPDTTPCQIRAKRGCATHPRSIAERVRRTRISEKMKKLQDLFPNMDKQTSTADMLDLAVQYIKDLQTQVDVIKEINHQSLSVKNKFKIHMKLPSNSHQPHYLFLLSFLCRHSQRRKRSVFAQTNIIKQACLTRNICSHIRKGYCRRRLLYVDSTSRAIMLKRRPVVEGALSLVNVGS